MYYQNHIMNLSRDSGLDTIEGHAGTPAGAQNAPRTDSLDSHDSISMYVTYSMVVLLSTGMTEVQANQNLGGASCPGLSPCPGPAHCCCPCSGQRVAAISNKLLGRPRWPMGPALRFPPGVKSHEPPDIKWVIVSRTASSNAFKMLFHKVSSLLESSATCCCPPSSPFRNFTL